MEDLHDFIAGQLLALQNEFENQQTAKHSIPLIHTYVLKIKPKSYHSNTTAPGYSKVVVKADFNPQGFKAPPDLIGAGSVPKLTSYNSTGTDIIYVASFSTAVPVFSKSLCDYAQ